MKKAFYYETQLGEIGIAENGEGITNIFFKGTVKPRDFVIEETLLLHKAATQLSEYLNGKRISFDLPISLSGTEFELLVWNALLEIPYGEVKSYKDIANKIGRPNACRAVGRANGLNPISIIIPCHRVIGSNGRLTGYAGGLDMKTQLLEIEQNNYKNSHD